MVKFRYFSPVNGSAAPRYGTGSIIGAIRTKDGFIWDTDAVVPIPISETRQYLKEYKRMLKRSPNSGACLIERSRAEYETYAAARGFEPIPDDKSETAGCNTGVTTKTILKKRGSAPIAVAASDPKLSNGGE